MNILALDPASEVGFAFGPAGSTPRTGTVIVKKSTDSMETAISRFAAWLHDLCRAESFELICIEHFLSPRFASSQNASILAIELYGSAITMAWLHSIKLIAPTPGEVRAYCCGRMSGAPRRRRGSAPRTERQTALDRAATKAMVISRAKMLGLIAKDCTSDDAADAALIWFWACCVHAHVPPKELVMFGEA